MMIHRYFANRIYYNIRISSWTPMMSSLLKTKALEYGFGGTLKNCGTVTLPT